MESKSKYWYDDDYEDDYDDDYDDDEIICKCGGDYCNFVEPKNEEDIMLNVNLINNWIDSILIEYKNKVNRYEENNPLTHIGRNSKIRHFHKIKNEENEEVDEMETGINIDLKCNNMLLRDENGTPLTDSFPPLIISSINIIPLYQKHNIFKRFLEKIEELAAEKNKYVVIAEVQALNKKLQDFLENRGYSAYKDPYSQSSPNYYRKFASSVIKSDGKRRIKSNRKKAQLLKKSLGKKSIRKSLKRKSKRKIF